MCGVLPVAVPRNALGFRSTARASLINAHCPYAAGCGYAHQDPGWGSPLLLDRCDERWTLGLVERAALLSLSLLLFLHGGREWDGLRGDRRNHTARAAPIHADIAVSLLAVFYWLACAVCSHA